MSYSKPQVVIDLDEYNALLTLKSLVDKEVSIAKEDIRPYQKALSSIVNACIKWGDPAVVKIVRDSPLTEDVVMNVIHRIDGGYDISCEMKTDFQKKHEF